ncbi:MAG: hypothetical protein E6K93_03340 [Thaumarchaeota archaeon]|nr:MAG: hypothetical protein E6K93_03340 [Nitrososphaerota archaeon]
MAKEKKKGPKKASKKEGKKKETSKGKSKEKTRLKEDVVQEDSGIIVVEDETKTDKEAELEARKAYLEEARSQEASED